MFFYIDGQNYSYIWHHWIVFSKGKTFICQGLEILETDKQTKGKLIEFFSVPDKFEVTGSYKSIFIFSGESDYFLII